MCGNSAHWLLFRSKEERYNRTCSCGIKIDAESGMRKMNEQKNPEISVIVPVYKVEKYLNECIDSVLAQTFAEFELILVDDSSPDNCPALCDAAAEKDERVRVIHKPNGGVGSARNAGLDAARGNWIFFMDSDDTVSPELLKKLHDRAAQEPPDAQPDLVICDFMRTNEQGGRSWYQERLVKDEALSQDDLIRKICLSPFVVVWGKLYRSELLRGIRFGDKVIGEDAVFQNEVFRKARKAVCVAEWLYHYRSTPNSLVRGKRTARNLEDQVSANYASFCNALEHGLTDVLCIYYWLMVKYYLENWRLISPEERKSEAAQRALTCRRTAWKQLRQAQALTPGNVFLAAVHRVCPPLYLRLKR